MDDEPDVCELIAGTLKREGYECSVAYTGEEAITLLEDRHFDLVMTDIMMPGMSGIDLLNVIKRLFPSVQVILVTAVDDKDTGIMAMEMGAIGYIIKPFKRNEILINVSRAMAKTGTKVSTLAAHPAVLESPGQGLPSAGRHREISASEVLHCLKSGMSDIELMERFNLSSEGLLDLLSRMGASGRIDQKKLDERALLSPQTVAVDIDQTDELKPDKPVISVGEAAKCIRSGMDDLALMKRFGISAKGLSSLFKKLIEADVLEPAEFYGRPRPDREFVLDMRDMQRCYLTVTTHIWEAERPDVKGWLLNVTERGLGTVGLKVDVGETLNIVIDTRDYAKIENIRARVKCIWTDRQADGQPTAGFQIAEISEDDLANLQNLVKHLTFTE